MYRLFSTNGKFDLQSPEKHPIATNEKKIIREVMAEWLN